MDHELRKRGTSEKVSTAPPVRRAALAFIFITVMLDMLALGMIIPVLPKLVERFMGGEHGAPPPRCSACSTPCGR